MLLTTSHIGGPMAVRCPCSESPAGAAAFAAGSTQRERSGSSMVDFHDRAIDAEGGDASEQGGFTRRRMVGYLIAGPTLMAAASLPTATARAAGIPTIQ